MIKKLIIAIWFLPLVFIISFVIGLKKVFFEINIPFLQKIPLFIECSWDVWQDFLKQWHSIYLDCIEKMKQDRLKNENCTTGDVGIGN